MARRRRLRRILLALLLIGIAVVVYAAWPASSTFTVGPETTFFTGPLDNDGLVDYVAAVNERLNKGITPESNANVLFWKALGPHPEGGTMPADYFKWLGYGPPEQGEYFMPALKYLEEVSHIEDSAKRMELDNHFAELASRTWSASAEPELMGWLARNETPLKVVIEGTRRSQYYNPLVPASDENGRGMMIGCLLPSVQKCRQIAHALCCRAMLQTGEGRFDDAWRDLIACHRLGRLVARGGTLIEALVGIALESNADKAIAAYLAEEKLDSTVFLERLKELQAEPVFPPIGEKLDLVERCICLDAVEFMAYGLTDMDDLSTLRKPGPKNRGIFDRAFSRSVNWDPALKTVNSAYDRMVANSHLTDRVARAKAHAELDNEVKLNRPASQSIAANLVLGPKRRGEIIGNLLIGLLLPAEDKVQAAFDRCIQIDRNVQVAFALAAYRADNGKYPAKLADLVPKYLASVPEDLFAGKPLIYRLEGTGYLLYSVGANGIDDGGRSFDDEPRGDDLVVRIPVVVKQPQK